LERISALLTPFDFIPGTVLDNVNCNALLPERREILELLLRRFELDGKEDQDPVSLSDGEKRKLQIIMTLLKDADFYVFDEPLANVDSASCNKVMTEILAHTKGKGLIVVMHGGERYRDIFDREFHFGEATGEKDPAHTSSRCAV
jgi:ABC-type multidrug transport system ATPase subunit